MIAITINLEELRALMIEYIAEREQAGDVIRALTLSGFLIYLQNKVKENESVEEESSSITSIETYRHAH